MTELRVVQVSDPHLSRHKAYYQNNWETFLTMMADDPPDLVVCTGDLCVDAVEHPDDLAFAREQLGRLRVPWRVIPGNHDVGDQPPDLKFGQPIDDAKRARWLDYFGHDWWAADHGAWRLIGLNAMLFDSNLAAEHEQWAWLEHTLNARAERPVMLFVHKPLFLVDAQENRDSTLHYAPGTRRRLLDLAHRHDVRIIGSGHLHRHWSGMHDGVQLVWAPSVGFIISGFPAGLAIGACEVGFVEYRLSGTAFSHRINQSAKFVPNDMREAMERMNSTVNLPPRPRDQG